MVSRGSIDSEASLADSVMPGMQYDELRTTLSSCDPRIKKSVFSISQLPDTALPSKKWVPWCRARPRVLALHLNPDGSCNRPIEYTDASGLAAHLKRRAAATDNTFPRSVYLLEGLDRNFMAALGDHFQLHPSLFMDHERLTPFGERLTGEGGGLPFLPSAVHSRDHVSIKYHEPLVLSKRPMDFRNICDTSGRTIAVTRLMGEFSPVGICRRKCTFWGKADTSGGWNCLIICDPPIRRVQSDYRGPGREIETSPYGFGYIDFMPLLRQAELRAGPPRSSMLDDLSFYIQHHASVLDLSQPNSLRFFVEKIIANHYLQLATFLQTNIEIVQWKLSRQNNLTSFAVDTAEELWSDIQAWERRMAEYHDDIEGAMLQLGIPLGSAPDTGRVQSFTESTADFQFLRLRFQQVGQRVHALAGAISALAGLAGNRAMYRAAELSLKEAEQARRQARSLKALTILGVVFLPLSFPASILSMAELYLPGGAMFWVYFSVAVPLLGVVALVYMLAEIGNRDDEVKWSFTAVLERIRRVYA